MEQTRLNAFFREKINKKNIKRLKNTNFTLISNNCNGGFLYHDLGLKFNSPFINLWLKPGDYIKYLKNINHYMNAPLKFIKEENINYPVALLDDIKIFFQHYETPEIAEKKWIERTNRMNLDNLFIIFIDGRTCTKEMLTDFDNLPFKNKIVFTNKPDSNFKSSFFIKGLKKNVEIDHIYKFQNKFSGKKYYDQFDYITWFNSNIEK